VDKKRHPTILKEYHHFLSCKRIPLTPEEEKTGPRGEGLKKTINGGARTKEKCWRLKGDHSCKDGKNQKFQL